VQTNSDEEVRLPRELSIAVGDASGGVGPPADGDAAVADVDVGMVVLGLREVAEAADEGDRLGEGRKLQLADERAVDLAPVLRHGHATEYGSRNDRRADVLYDGVQAHQEAGLLARSRKQRPGTEFLCERVFRPLANLVVSALLPLRVPPPVVVLSATAVGLLAATELALGQLIGAAVLLQVKTILDNADGQLARASGRVSELGRYLDTLSDLVVNAALFAAIGYATGRPFLALTAFVVLTAVLSFDYNLDRLYRAEQGQVDKHANGGRASSALGRLYGLAFGWQDRLIERLTNRRAGADPATRQVYHDRATLHALANVGLSTQLAVLGVLLVLGHPGAYCWVALGCGIGLVLLLLRREALARREPTGPAPAKVAS
jgi:archaetidylinositol phosphate synthase